MWFRNFSLFARKLTFSLKICCKHLYLNVAVAQFTQRQRDIYLFLFHCHRLCVCLCLLNVFCYAHHLKFCCFWSKALDCKLCDIFATKSLLTEVRLGLQQAIDLHGNLAIIWQQVFLLLFYAKMLQTLWVSFNSTWKSKVKLLWASSVGF